MFDALQAGVEVCIELGRLGMGRDALLAAILGGVLRPETSREHFTHPGFGRAPVTVVDIREGFGKNVARLVEGVEHVTCVEETAHRVLRGRHSGSRSAREDLESATGWAAKKQDDGDDDEPLSLAMLIGARERLPGEPARGTGRGVKPRSLREASALEQVGVTTSTNIPLARRLYLAWLPHLHGCKELTSSKIFLMGAHVEDRLMSSIRARARSGNVMTQRWHYPLERGESLVFFGNRAHALCGLLYTRGN